MRAIGEQNIIGNVALRTRLYSDIKAGTLSHAYIIEGKPGSGRHTLAKNIIASLACTSNGDTLPCGQCKDCRDIFEGICPDVMTIGREDKASLGIDAVRSLKSTIMAVANNLEFKAYILEDADTMTVQAQNAFLLTLEQPPTRVYFFIICENARSLLETIRSRASILRTEPLSDEDVESFIFSERAPKEITLLAKSLKNDNPEEYRTVLMSAEGSIGRAIELLRPKTRKPIVEARELTMRLINSISSNGRTEPALMLFSTFSQKRDVLSDQLEYIKNALRDLILLKKHEEVPLCFFSDRESASELSSMMVERRLISVYEEVDRAQSAINSNANVRLTLIDLLSKL